MELQSKLAFDEKNSQIDIFPSWSEYTNCSLLDTYFYSANGLIHLSVSRRHKIGMF